MSAGRFGPRPWPGVWSTAALAVAVVATAASSTAQPTPQINAPSEQAALPDPARELVRRLSFGKYRKNVRRLAGFGSRYALGEGNEQARDWIQEQLESFGYVVERHSFVATTTFLGGGSKRVDSVYATKVGTVHPDRMYIASAHMDSINFDSRDQSFAPGADDDASGTALVLELARVMNTRRVQTDTSIRFILWNAEELGLLGSRAYVEERRALQGIESPPGSGLYPEPRWEGVIQHDMLLFDRGLPTTPGFPGSGPLDEADVDIEYDADEPSGGSALELASALLTANARYASTGFPAEVGQFMQSTDSVPFAPFVAAVSVRENERRNEIGNRANPHWHRSTDVFATYTNADFRLGYTALQMTTGALAVLAGATTAGEIDQSLEITAGWGENPAR